MEIEAKAIGAGLAVIGVIGSGIALAISSHHLFKQLEEILQLGERYLQ